MRIIDVDIERAEAFLKVHERHYVEPSEKICAIAVGEAGASENEPVIIHGAAILGRVSPGVACLAHIYCDGASQGYSLLYGACWRALKALGYHKAVL